MATMSYCAFENTSNDMATCIEKLEEFEIEEWNKYERSAVRGLYKLCKEYIQLYEESDTDACLEELDLLNKKGEM